MPASNDEVLSAFNDEVMDFLRKNFESLLSRLDLMHEDLVEISTRLEALSIGFRGMRFSLAKS